LRAAAFIMVGLPTSCCADIMLGAEVPPEVMRAPMLDSQNRFYGAAFALCVLLAGAMAQ
jgi:hypothetical protein